MPPRRAPLSRRPARADRPRGLWVEVDPGFYVGNDRNQFLGSIKGTALEGFSAFGPTSSFVGHFAEIEQAKAALVGVLAADAPAVLTH